VLESLPSAADAREASGGDLLVTHLVTRFVTDPPSYRFGAAVAVWTNFWGRPELAVVGPGPDAAKLLGELDPALIARGHEASIVATAVPLLPERFGVSFPWAFRWTDAPPPRPVGDGIARWLDATGATDATAEAEVGALLDRGFPDASMRPGDPHLRRWAGLRDAGGVLVACAGDATGDDSLGFLASIASDPELRGRGYGAQISAWSTQQLLREHGTVGLWHMGDNVRADAVYTALGYRDEHRMVVVAGSSGPCGV
jgi:GNAT superfamily N-acetyltransferase